MPFSYSCMLILAILVVLLIASLLGRTEVRKDESGSEEVTVKWAVKLRLAVRVPEAYNQRGRHVHGPHHGQSLETQAEVGGPLTIRTENPRPTGKVEGPQHEKTTLREAETHENIPRFHKSRFRETDVYEDSPFISRKRAQLQTAPCKEKKLLLEVCVLGQD